MGSLNENIYRYKKLLADGSLKDGYRGLIGIIKAFKGRFEDKHPDFTISGPLKNGLMDYTYFHFTTPALSKHKLKIVFLFEHNEFCFTVFLAGLNKKVQEKYLAQFQQTAWENYKVAATTKATDYILYNRLIEEPNFNDINLLNEQLEEKTLRFVREIETFLVEQ